MMDGKRTLIATTATLLLSLQGCGVESAEFSQPARSAATVYSHAAHTDSDRLAKPYKVRFYHPANKSGGEESRTLFQVPADTGASYHSHFYMDVPSVYCGEGICKIDIVRLHWDWLGRYAHFSLEPSKDLEKGDEQDFTEADYQKLQRVLSDQESGLADLRQDELILPNAGGERVDGLTGATVSLRKSDYVEGAIWTCYTLWHFANGELTGLIRNLSGDAIPTNELSMLTASNSNAEVVFALQQLARKDLESIDATGLVTQLLQQQKAALYPDIFDYLKRFPAEKALQILQPFAETQDSHLRLEIIDYLQQVDAITDKTLLTGLSRSTAHWSSFDEVHRLLTLLKKHGSNDPTINHSISSLLEHDNFVIARNTYWYLAEAPKDSIDQALLNEFREQNLPRL